MHSKNKFLTPQFLVRYQDYVLYAIVLRVFAVGSLRGLTPDPVVTLSHADPIILISLQEHFISKKVIR